MRTAIMQPYFCPHIGYFQLINAVEVFIVYDDVNYIKKGWINRNSILINGEKYLFSIPLKKLSQNKLINQIDIHESSNWKNSLLKQIEQSYKKAPFFTDVYPLIKEIILQDKNNLAEFIIHSLNEICKYLSITTRLIISSGIKKNNELKGQNKIIEICKTVQASHYINAMGGKDLYDRDIFLQHNFSLNFIKPEPIIYPQFDHEFHPCLSIIDVMMFNSVPKINGFLKQYELV